MSKGHNFSEAYIDRGNNPQKRGDFFELMRDQMDDGKFALEFYFRIHMKTKLDVMIIIIKLSSDKMLWLSSETKFS